MERGDRRIEKGMEGAGSELEREEMRECIKGLERG